jgi:excisionase family DNA binding protein
MEVSMPKKRSTSPAGAPGRERDDDVLDMDQAIAHLRTTKPTMYRWVAQGKIQGFKAGRQWRFYRRDLRKFLEYEDPTVVRIDLEAVRDAIKALDARIAKARAARRKGAKK